MNFKDIFFIAEIGSGPKGDLERAKKMIDSAVEAGADAVKFQSFHTSSLVHPEYIKKYSVGTIKDLSSHFKECEFSESQFIELHAYAASKKILFMSTPFDVEFADFLDKLVPCFKIASSEMTDFPLIKKVLSKNKPVLISTGAHDFADVIKTLEFIKRQNPELLRQGKIIFLHCVATYPTPDESANLLSVKYLHDKLNVPAGYSDHTFGNDACLIAVAFGAKVIEKHFTDDKSKGYFIHRVAADKGDFRQIIEEAKRLKDFMRMKGTESMSADEFIQYFRGNISDSEVRLKKIRSLLGVYDKFIQASETEKKSDESFKRGMYFNKSLKKGRIIQEQDIISLRPLLKWGVGAKDYESILGKRLKCNVGKLSPVKKEFFD